MKWKLVSCRIWIMALVSPGSDRKPVERPAMGDEVVDQPREEDRGEQVRDQAERQRDGEALDRTGAELEQEQRRQQRRHVRVEDRAEGVLVPELDRRADRLAVPHLLADT